jgi:hypothetical protein
MLARDLGDGAVINGRHISAWIPRDEGIRRLEKLMSTVDMDQLEDVRLVTPSLEDVFMQTGKPSSVEDELR